MREQTLQQSLLKDYPNRQLWEAYQLLQLGLVAEWSYPLSLAAMFEPEQKHIWSKHSLLLVPYKV
jgi:hypothetical protein